MVAVERNEVTQCKDMRLSKKDSIEYKIYKKWKDRHS